MQLDPDFPVTYALRGAAYHDLGEYTKQAADEAKACSLDSKYC